MHGLLPEVKDQSITLEIPEELDKVIAMTNKIDQGIQKRERERKNEEFLQFPVT